MTVLCLLYSETCLTDTVISYVNCKTHFYYRILKMIYFQYFIIDTVEIFLYFKYGVCNKSKECMITNTISLFLTIETTLYINFVVIKEKEIKAIKLPTNAHKISTFHRIFLR